MNRPAWFGVLAPMTALQAVVAVGLFALATLAPQLGLGADRLGQLHALLFALGALTAFGAGRLLGRFGGWGLAASCAGLVALGLAALALGGAAAAGFAVLCFGLAFGPETPASTALLARVTPPARRPLVFSLRQTGNQLGAIAGSLTLPALWLLHPRLPFAAGALLAAGVALWCWRRGGRRGPAPQAQGMSQSAAALDTTAADTTAADTTAPDAPAHEPPAPRWRAAPVQALALATLAYSALQMSLNVFLLSHLVTQGGLAPAAAAGWIALLQAGGLAGRLLWGLLAPAGRPLARGLGALGLLAAGCGALLIADPGLPGRDAGLAAPLLLALGFGASGWNGLLVAEVARIAGPAQAGAWAGRMLGHGYLGLTLAPLLFAAAGARSGTVFTALLAGVALSGLLLLALRPVATGPAR